jgi:hypothetical protein
VQTEEQDSFSGMLVEQIDGVTFIELTPLTIPIDATTTIEEGELDIIVNSSPRTKYSIPKQAFTNKIRFKENEIAALIPFFQNPK